MGGRNDAECPDLMSRSDMRPAAWTGIIVADMYDPDCIASVLGKPAKIKLLASRYPVEKLLAHLRTGPDHGVDFFLEGLHFVRRKITFKAVVALGFFLLKMSRKRAGTSEGLYHGPIQDVLGGVHPGIDLFF